METVAWSAASQPTLPCAAAVSTTSAGYHRVPTDQTPATSDRPHEHHAEFRARQMTCSFNVLGIRASPGAGEVPRQPQASLISTWEWPHFLSHGRRHSGLSSKANEHVWRGHCILTTLSECVLSPDPMVLQHMVAHVADSNETLDANATSTDLGVAVDMGVMRGITMGWVRPIP